MSQTIVLVHAEGEENLAEDLYTSLQEAGYTSWHRGLVMVGESFLLEMNNRFQEGGPVVVCGTRAAMGSKYVKHWIAAANPSERDRIFIMRMHIDADVESISFGKRIGEYWKDKDRAIHDLIGAIKKHFPAAPSGEAHDGGSRPSLELLKDYCIAVIRQYSVINSALYKSDDFLSVAKPDSEYPDLRDLYVPLRVSDKESEQAGVTRKRRSSVDNGAEPHRREELPQTTKPPNDLELRGQTQPNAAMGAKVGTKEKKVSSRLPIGTVLASTRRLVLLGDPGSGKTTLVNWIAIAYAMRLAQDPQWKALPDVASLPDLDALPIVVRCRYLDDSVLHGSIPELARHCLRKVGFASDDVVEVLASYMLKRLKAGTAILMLDGLDEIPDPSTRDHFFRQIVAEATVMKNAYVIVTSRVAGYREINYQPVRNFRHIFLSDLDNDNKEALIRKVYLADGEKYSSTLPDELISEVHDSDRLKRLSGNPMLLTMIAMVKAKIGKLPNREYRIYYEALKITLDARNLHWSETIPPLSCAAYSMTVRCSQRISEHEFIDIFSQVQGERWMLALRERSPESFLKMIEVKTWLLRAVGHVERKGLPERLFEFPHLMFQEYLTARAIVDGHLPEVARGKSIAERVALLPNQTSGGEHADVAVNWWEALHLVAAMSGNEADDVLLAILTKRSDEPESVGRIRASLATACLAETPNISRSFAEQILEAYVRYVTPEDGRGAAKTAHDKAAVELANSQFADSLVRLLVDDYHAQRTTPGSGSAGVAVLMASAKSFDAAAASKWLESQAEALRDGDDKAATSAALSVLGYAFGGRHVPMSRPTSLSLIEALLHRLQEGSPMTRAAALALYWLNGGTNDDMTQHWVPSVNQINLLLEYCAKFMGDDYTLVLLVKIFIRQKTEEAFDFLVHAIVRPSVELRTVAVQALEQIGDARAQLPLIDRLENDEDAGVRSAAGLALRRVRSDLTSNALRSAIMRDPSADVRSACVRSLRELCGASAIDYLVPILNDDDEQVQLAAVDALSNLQDDRIVEALETRLNGASPILYRAIIMALAGSEATRAAEIVAGQLGSDDPEVRVVAAHRQGHLRDELTVAQLSAHLRDLDPRVRRALASALGKTREQAAVEPLTDLLHTTETSDVRRAAIAALAQVGGHVAERALVRLLVDEDPEIRRASALSLGKLPSAEGVDFLIRLMEDEAEAPAVRNAAIWALGESKSEIAGVALLRNFAAGEASTKTAVLRAFGRIGTVDAVEKLLEGLKDDDTEVRRTTVEVIGDLRVDRAAAPLAVLLRGNDSYLKMLAVRALGRLRAEFALDPLVTYLAEINANKNEAKIRAEIARALGQMGGERALGLLMRLLKDDDDEVRSTAVQVLADGKTEILIDPLVSLLEEANDNVRNSAADALALINSESTLDPLLTLISKGNILALRVATSTSGRMRRPSESEVGWLVHWLATGDDEVRPLAAKILGRTKSEMAVVYLIQSLSDPNHVVRYFALWALGAIGSKTAVEASTPYLQDADPDMRRAALTGLGADLSEIDDRLLSEHFDSANVAIDPREPITEQQLIDASTALELSIDEVQTRYESLSQKFGLQLGWKTNLPPALS